MSRQMKNSILCVRFYWSLLLKAIRDFRSSWEGLGFWLSFAVLLAAAFTPASKAIIERVLPAQTLAWTAIALLLLRILWTNYTLTGAKGPLLERLLELRTRGVCLWGQFTDIAGRMDATLGVAEALNACLGDFDLWLSEHREWNTNVIDALKPYGKEFRFDTLGIVDDRETLRAISHGEMRRQGNMLAMRLDKLNALISEAEKNGS
jgi:hypothetical protein